MTKTIRMTVAQAIVKFLDNQYVSMDGEETKFVEGFFTIFGHGIAVGLGEALDTDPGQLRVLQGRNEQGMCHVATAFAKQSNRKKIIPCASSVGPGAANMVTACACLGRICQNSHCINECCHDHLWSCDAVPVLTHRLECIIGCCCQAVALL